MRQCLHTLRAPRQMRSVTDRGRKYSVQGFFLIICLLLVIAGFRHATGEFHTSDRWASILQWTGYESPRESARAGGRGLMKRDVEVWPVNFIGKFAPPLTYLLLVSSGTYC